MSVVAGARACIVLDTNIVLDALVFGDAAAQPLVDALRQGRLQWLATDAMRSELARVLAYPQIAARLAACGRDAGEVLRGFDDGATLLPQPPRAPALCADPDDQKFVDLAVARRATLLSKDRAVLAMRRRLAPWSVPVHATLPTEPTHPP